MRPSDSPAAGGDPPVRLWRRGEPGYPERLEHLDVPPDILWACGRQPPTTPAVAIVGSRSPTVSGRQIARELGAELAEAGIQVVSGFALGIDGAAHRGAVEAGGSTIAVLGCGLDVPYPRDHDELRRSVAGTGMLLTEHPRGTAPEAWHFPRRNRIIAALAVAVVVVEASERSGALSTARWARDLGRDVLAVPGSIRSDRSAGTNRLIRDGARPFLEIRDLAEAVPELAALLPLVDRGRRGSAMSRAAGSAPGLDPDLLAILDRIGRDAVHPDDLAADLGLPASALASRLTALELQGLVVALPGGLVARCGG